MRERRWQSLLLSLLPNFIDIAQGVSKLLLSGIKGWRFWDTLQQRHLRPVPSNDSELRYTLLLETEDHLITIINAALVKM